MTVFLVDDDATLREPLKALLRKDGFTCRSYATAAAFLEQLEPQHMGCIITEAGSPKTNGIALVKRLQRMGCSIPVIVIVGGADVRLAIQAMKAGVQDLVEKPFKNETIMKAVRRCLDLTRDAEARKARCALIDCRLAKLTPREEEILHWIVEGLSNKEVGLTLGISPRTVDIHRAHLMLKMQAESLADLVRMTSAATPSSKRLGTPGPPPA